MPDDPKQVMADTLSEVLEGMAFTFVDPSDEEVSADGHGEYFHATISFSGTVSGELGLVAPLSLCGELTAGILGQELDEVATPANMSDTLGELLNVTCGNFLTSMFGNERAVDQSVPCVKQVGLPEWKILHDSPGVIRLMVDDVPLLAHVQVQEPA